MKTCRDYANEILEAVQLAIEEKPGSLDSWEEKYGYDCLSEIITKIVKRAMRHRKKEAR